MNPKINKLKTEKAKNIEKISALQRRNREIDSSVLELENLDIIGMVRACGMTPEMLAELIKAAKKNPLPDNMAETEVGENDSEE